VAVVVADVVVVVAGKEGAHRDVGRGALLRGDAAEADLPVHSRRI
jgi:hypothetical protein